MPAIAVFAHSESTIPLHVQASELHTVGFVLEWLSPGNTLQLGSPGSGSSGWRLVDPSPLCPLLSTALLTTPPECADAVDSGKLRESTGKRECCDAEPGESCAWEEGGSGGQFLGDKWPPLRSTIVLPAPLDPVLQIALSVRVNIRSPNRSKEETLNEEGKPSHIGLWFHRAPEPAEISYEGSGDEGISGAVSGEWTVGGMSRDLQGTGAHRQLLTKVVLPPKENPSEGERPVRFVALVEALPTGVYADKFEVQRLAADKGESDGGVLTFASCFTCTVMESQTCTGFARQLDAILLLRVDFEKASS